MFLDYSGKCHGKVGERVYSPEGDEGENSSIEMLTEDRCGCPALSVTLGNTGFTSLADKKRLCQWSTGIV